MTKRKPQLSPDLIGESGAQANAGPTEPNGKDVDVGNRQVAVLSLLLLVLLLYHGIIVALFFVVHLFQPEKKNGRV